MEGGRNDTDRGFDAVLARRDATQIGQSRDQADRSMTAHPQVTDIIKKDHSGNTRGIGRLNQARAHDDIRATRFIDDSRTEAIVLVAKNLQLFRQGPTPQVRRAADHNTSGLASSVRIDDGEAFHSAAVEAWARGA